MAVIAQRSQYAWWCMVAITVLVAHADLESSDAADTIVELAADAEKPVFTKDTQGVLPPGTSTLRHVDNVDHGKCRFSCHEEPLCSGYSFTPAKRECVLLQAPNHFDSPSANNAWHLAAAKLTGVAYQQDPTDVEMLKMAQTVAAQHKEDARRGKLSLNEHMKEAIEAVKAQKRAKLKTLDTASGIKQAQAEANFAIAEIRKYFAAHSSKFKADNERMIEFEAKEQAKRELRSTPGVKMLEKDGFKTVSKKLFALTEKRKDAVKGKVARKLTIDFMRDMNKFVNAKVTGFREELLMAKEAKEAGEKKKAQAADAKAKEAKKVAAAKAAAAEHKAELKKVEAKKSAEEASP